MRKSLLILIITIYSCVENSHQSTEDLYKDELTLERFIGSKNHKRVFTSDLSKFKVPDLTEFKPVPFKLDFFFYEEDSLFIKRTQINIDDSIVIEIFDESNQSDLNFTLLNGKVLDEFHYYGELFVKNSEISYHYNNRRIYKNDNQLLMVEQPSRWCGLANQFDMYQLIDLTASHNSIFCAKGSLLGKKSKR